MPRQEIPEHSIYKESTLPQAISLPPTFNQTTTDLARYTETWSTIENVGLLFLLIYF